VPRFLTRLALALMLLGMTSAAAAREIVPAPAVQQTRPAHAPTDLGPSDLGASTVSDKDSKLESSLVAIERTAQAESVAAALGKARDAGMSVVGAQVRVIVEASGGSLAGTETAVAVAGGTVEAGYANLVQASVPIDALKTLANDPSVAYVRPPAASTSYAVTGEGVVASGANTWQAAGVNGSGVKVGVIDFGFTGYQQRQASGDLPASLVAADFCNGAVTAPGNEHGTAVAEIVSEMAPGIQLYLLCIGGEVQLGQAKDYAKANGIQILSSSIGFSSSSRGDVTGPPGSPAAIIADAADSGILWVTAAGNSAQKHWSGTFTDVDNDGFHEFASGDETQSIFLSNGQRACFDLKWDSWPTTAQDFDLLLARSSDLTLVAASATTQNGTQTPTEFFCYTNVAASQYFELIIRKFQATQAPRFDLFVFNGSVALQYLVAAGSLDEMAATPKAFGVGALCWQSNQLEPYSSQGPTIDGRVKPDIAGQSVVSSASEGPFTSCADSGFPGHGFNGTSAAQPHVAGAAALVKQANPGFTPSQIQAFLEARAIDQGAPGKDNQFGAGRLALGAAPAAATATPTATAPAAGPGTATPTPTPTATPASSAACNPRPNVAVTATPVGGRLQVTITATGQGNVLQSIQFGANTGPLANALIDLPDSRTGLSNGFTQAISPSATSFTFWVRRAVAGQATTVPVVVTDKCGTWPTFVGGGPAAGF
jgi:hypothetical protein